jgi:hypothetical protein
MGFLMSAMIRIRSLIQTDLTQMPNTRIMISFIVVFALFALSSVGEGLIIFMTEFDSKSFGKAAVFKALYVTYSVCSVVSQIVLIFLFFKIGS